MKKIIGFVVIAVFILSACKTRQGAIYFLSPEEGSAVSEGKAVTIRLDVNNASFDSIKYLLDTSVIASKTDTSAVSVPTAGLPVGVKVLSARVYNGAEFQEVNTNVVVVASNAPVQYKYEVVNVFPHDTSSFTEGLEYHDGLIYESAGEKGHSSLRKAELKTGKVIQKVDLEDQYFGEGMTVIGDKIIQITYREGVGFVYDKSSLKKLAQFPYQAGREGWGLYFDGKRVLNTDGTNNIYFLNKDTYQKEGGIEVYDHKGPVHDLNELEMVDGKIYANVFMTDKIVIINPETGIVEGEIDLTDLYPAGKRNPNADVLNGIAWDPAGRRLFVTGKRWDKLFELRVSAPAL